MTLSWCDTHCHFDFPAFQERERHWPFVQKQGVAALIIPGVNAELGAQLSHLCQDKPWYYAQGVHPYFINQHQNKDLDWLEVQLRTDHKIIAVGEVGLDKIMVKQANELENQWHYFEQQVQLAKAYRKPLILHVRGLHDEMCSYLRRNQFDLGGIVHAFSGSQQQAKAWLQLGFHLGIGGAMTHPRAQKLRQTVKSIPHQHWLLETDSPDMKSAFWGAEHHSPAAIPLLAACLAALQGCTLETIAFSQKAQIQALFPQIVPY